jgi:hypothetical protein
MKANLGKAKLGLLCAFSIVVFTIWSNVGAFAQNTTTTAGNGTTTATSSQQHVSKIKITSPTRGQQVPVGKDLTISGTSMDNATSNCQVAVTSKYTTIKQGDNRITARFECVDNPATKGFSSVNVTGANQ